MKMIWKWEVSHHHFLLYKKQKIFKGKDCPAYGVLTLVYPRHSASLGYDNQCNCFSHPPTIERDVDLHSFKPKFIETESESKKILENDLIYSLIL